MSSDSTVLGSASLGGSLYEPSALFEDWKRTLVFQYDFVKTLIEKNTQLRDEMDQMEREISRLREEKLEMGRKSSIYQRPLAWEEGFTMFSDEGLKTKPLKLPAKAPKPATNLALVIIDGDVFRLDPNLLLQGFAGGCFAARQLSSEIARILASTRNDGDEPPSTVVHIYASLERLAQSLSKESIRTAELVSHFVRGFNSVEATMDFVDVGDENGLICQKMIDQIRFFLKLSICQAIIVGLDTIDSENEFLSTLSLDDLGNSEICLLKPPTSDDTEDFEPLNLIIPFTTASLTGLFVPKTPSTSHKLSYVDIVKYTSPKRNTESGDTGTGSARKVSNASTVSTQADDELSNATKDYELKPTSGNSKPFFDEVTSNLESDFSELSSTLRQRKVRMEGRRKDSQPKKPDNGLFAIVPCPKEEPDRRMLSFIRNLPEKPCNKFYLSKCLFDECQYSHEFEFSEKQVSAMAWIVKSSPCPEWESCENGDNCIYGHVCRWNDNGKCRKYGTGCRFPRGGHPKTK